MPGWNTDTMGRDALWRHVYSQSEIKFIGYIDKWKHRKKRDVGRNKKNIEKVKKLKKSKN